MSKLYAIAVYGTLGFGMLAWALLILGSLVGLAGSEPWAERLFSASGYAAGVFIPLLVAAILLTVLGPKD